MDLIDPCPQKGPIPSRPTKIPEAVGMLKPTDVQRHRTTSRGGSTTGILFSDSLTDKVPSC